MLPLNIAYQLDCFNVGLCNDLHAWQWMVCISQLTYLCGSAHSPRRDIIRDWPRWTSPKNECISTRTKIFMLYLHVPACISIMVLLCIATFACLVCSLIYNANLLLAFSPHTQTYDLNKFEAMRYTILLIHEVRAACRFIGWSHTHWRCCWR
jgi:hypothetical protein